jgi:hypothetical protein
MIIKVSWLASLPECQLEGDNDTHGESHLLKTNNDPRLKIVRIPLLAHWLTGSPAHCHLLN